MPKYWVKNYFAHGRFPEVGQQQKTEREKREEKKLNDGNNNGQLRIAANATLGDTRKTAWANRFNNTNKQGFLWTFVLCLCLGKPFNYRPNGSITTCVCYLGSMYRHHVRTPVVFGFEDISTFIICEKNMHFKLFKRLRIRYSVVTLKNYFMNLSKLVF